MKYEIKIKDELNRQAAEQAPETNDEQTPETNDIKPIKRT